MLCSAAPGRGERREWLVGVEEKGFERGERRRRKRGKMALGWGKREHTISVIGKGVVDSRANIKACGRPVVEFKLELPIRVAVPVAVVFGCVVFREGDVEGPVDV